MYGYIYLTTNLINGKKYIGMHKSSEFDPKYKGSGKILLEAIRKYGEENFKVEILETYETAESLHIAEQDFIEKFDACNSKDYYNIKQGGFGGWKINGVSIKKGVKISEEARRNVSLAHMGKPWSDAQKKAHEGLFVKEKNPFYGKDFSPETKAKLSQIRRGRIWVNNGEKETNCPPDKVSEYLNQGYTLGRLKNSVSKMRMNSTYKFKWMTYNGIDCKVHFEDVDKMLLQGWVFGRTKGCRRATTIESISNEKDITE